jgi:hypothetical protein
MPPTAWSEILQHALPEFLGVALGTVAIAGAIALWGYISKNPALLYGSIGAMPVLIIAVWGYFYKNLVLLAGSIGAILMLVIVLLGYDISERHISSQESPKIRQLEDSIQQWRRYSEQAQARSTLEIQTLRSQMERLQDTNRKQITDAANRLNSLQKDTQQQIQASKRRISYDIVVIESLAQYNNIDNQRWKESQQDINDLFIRLKGQVDSLNQSSDDFAWNRLLYDYRKFYLPLILILRADELHRGIRNWQDIKFYLNGMTDPAILRDVANDLASHARRNYGNGK